MAHPWRKRQKEQEIWQSPSHEVPPDFLHLLQSSNFNLETPWLQWPLQPPLHHIDSPNVQSKKHEVLSAKSPPSWASEEQNLGVDSRGDHDVPPGAAGVFRSFRGLLWQTPLGPRGFSIAFLHKKTKHWTSKPPNLQRASSSLNLNPFPRKKNPFPSRGSLSKLWWDVGNGVAGARLVPLQGLVVPSSLPFLQFHPESPQKSLQWQSLSKSSYMDELELGLGFLGAFCCWKPVVVVCGRGIDSHNFSRGGPSSERRRIQWRHYRPIFQIFFLLNNL